MDITIDRNELLPALQVVNGVVERRQPLPILVNLLLTTVENGIRLAASDMEVELIATLEMKRPEKVEVTLPARKLLDICRALPEGAKLTIKLSAERAQVVSGKSRFTLSTLPAQEFPLIEMPAPAAEFNISQAALKELLEKTAFSMAQQDVRYYLNGLLLELRDKTIRAVATDGHRLALYDAASPVSFDEKRQIIIPRKGIMELIRLLDGGEEEVTVQISNNHLRVVFPRLIFTSKLIDGKFPDYDRVIPQLGKNLVVAERESLRQSLIRASILSNEKYRGVRILLEKGLLKALAHNPEQEEAEEEVGVEYEGPGLEIGFNVSYLLDALSIIRTRLVRITIHDPNSSCLLLPEDTENCKYVVMPMRL